MHIILVSSRRECLRSATVDNLVDVGFHGWTSLVLRFDVTFYIPIKNKSINWIINVYKDCFFINAEV